MERREFLSFIESLLYASYSSQHCISLWSLTSACYSVKFCMLICTMPCTECIFYKPGMKRKRSALNSAGGDDGPTQTIIPLTDCHLLHSLWSKSVQYVMEFFSLSWILFTVIDFSLGLSNHLYFGMTWPQNISCFHVFNFLYSLDHKYYLLRKFHLWGSISPHKWGKLCHNTALT